MMNTSPRYGFGDNWLRYIRYVTEAHVNEAQQSLVDLLERDDMHDLTFLDIGCGSGLFSLAACRLGAQVRSFDFDPGSVKAAIALRDRFLQDGAWEIELGSVLDRDYLRTLGVYDVVYTWGVLHHTGAMWDAMAAVEPLVGPTGLLVIAIYNDQGWRSQLWCHMKRAYNVGPKGTRPFLDAVAMVGFWGLPTVTDMIRLRPGYSRRRYILKRGMSPATDVRDWMGGYPFEVATPHEVIAFWRRAGFSLRSLRTTRRSGCNQFVFARAACLGH